MSYTATCRSLLFSLGLTLGACQTSVDWLVVEAEIEELCIVDMSTDFEGTPGGLVSQVLGGEELGINLSEKFETAMYLRGLGATAAGGVDNLDFIDSLRLEVSSADSEPVELLNFVAGTGPEDLSFVQSSSAIDIATFIEAEDLQLMVEFAGELPTTAWTANMELCVSAQAAYREEL